MSVPSPPIDTASMQSPQQPPCFTHHDDELIMTNVMANRSFEQVSDARSHGQHHHGSSVINANSRSTMFSGRTGYAARDRLSESTARQSATVSADGVPWLGDCSLLLKTNSDEDTQYLHYCLAMLPYTLEGIFRIRHAAVSSQEMSPVTALKFNLYLGWVSCLLARIETATPTLQSNVKLTEVTDAAATFATKWRRKDLGSARVIENSFHHSAPLVQGAREFSASTADVTTDLTAKVVEFSTASAVKNVLAVLAFAGVSVALAAVGLHMGLDINGRELVAAMVAVLFVTTLMCLPIAFLLRALRRVHVVARADNLALRQLSHASFRLLTEARHEADVPPTQQVQPFTAPPPELHSGVDRSNSTQPPTAANARAASTRGPRPVWSSTESEPEAMLTVPKVVLDSLAVCAIDNSNTNVVEWSGLLSNLTGITTPASLSEALSRSQPTELNKLQAFWDTHGRAKPPSEMPSRGNAVQLTLHFGGTGRRGVSLCLEATAALLSGKPCVLLLHAAQQQCPQPEPPVQPAHPAQLAGSVRVQRALLHFALKPLCLTNPMGDTLHARPLVHFAPAALDLRLLRAIPAEVSGPACPEIEVATIAQWFNDAQQIALPFFDDTQCQVYRCPHVAVDGLRSLALQIAPCVSASSNTIWVRVAASSLESDVAILEVEIRDVDSLNADAIRDVFDGLVVPATAMAITPGGHANLVNVAFAMPCAQPSTFTLEERALRRSSLRMDSMLALQRPLSGRGPLPGPGGSLLPPQAAPAVSGHHLGQSLASPRANADSGWSERDDAELSLGLVTDQFERSDEALQDQENALRVLIIGSGDKPNALSDRLTRLIEPQPSVTVVDADDRLKSAMTMGSFQSDLAVIFDTAIEHFDFSAQAMRSHIFGRRGWGNTVVVVHVERNDAAIEKATLQQKRDLTADGRAGTPFAQGSILSVSPDARSPDEGEPYQIPAVGNAEASEVCRLWSTVDADFDDEFIHTLVAHPNAIKECEKRKQTTTFAPLLAAFEKDPPRTLKCDDLEGKVRLGSMTQKGGAIKVAVKRIEARVGDDLKVAALHQLQLLQNPQPFIVKLKRVFGEENPARNGVPRVTSLVCVLEKCEPLTPYHHCPLGNPYPYTQMDTAKLHDALVRTHRVLRQVAMALQSLHRAGWVHGNLSKDHVMVANDQVPTDTFPWSVRLVGLGSVRRIDTPNNAPEPELHRDPDDASAPVGPHVDVYSLGVLAMELTGWTPIESSPPNFPLWRRVRDHFDNAPPAPPELGELRAELRAELRGFILACLLPHGHSHRHVLPNAQFRAHIDTLLSDGLLARAFHRQDLISPREVA